MDHLLLVRWISPTCTMSSTSEWKKDFWNFFILIKKIICIFIIGAVFIITAVLILIVIFKSWNQRGFDTFKARKVFKILSILFTPHVQEKCLFRTYQLKPVRSPWKVAKCAQETWIKELIGKSLYTWYSLKNNW